jgi:hypothetical protein
MEAFSFKAVQKKLQEMHSFIMEEFSVIIVSYVCKMYDDFHDDVSEDDLVSICR